MTTTILKPERAYIIAEAGVNHNGDMQLALDMVDAAAAAGADAVKFQTFKAESLASADARRAAYQEAAVGEGSQLDMLKKLQLDQSAHQLVVDRCQKRGIHFMSTPFDLDSADFLHALGMPAFKISSGDVTNLPLLRRIASFSVPTILSTGMCDMDEVRAAVDALLAAGLQRDDLCLLHCTTQYPTPVQDVNLRAMLTLGEAFDVPTGYSDHTLGVEVPVAAAALGARVIEKHFTLDRTMEGPDHLASLEPDELERMVRLVRSVEQALGDGEKRPAPSELANREAARRSIVAARSIAAGEPFSEQNLTAKRPGTGLSPMRWDEVLGRPAPRDFTTDEPIEL